MLMLLSGCGGHQQSVIDPAGSQAGLIVQLWWFFLWLLGVIFVLVVAVMLWALTRKHRGIEQEPLERTHVPSPETERRMSRVVTGASILTVAILLGLIVMSIATGKSMSSLGNQKNGIAVEVTGNQWWWYVRYLNDDASKIVVTANEIHIPVGRPVMIRATSNDVIHSFWVPNLHGKRDLIPSRVNVEWIQADHPGRYRGQCAEFCGQQHAHMALWVIAESEQEFEKWAETAETAGGDPRRPSEAAWPASVPEQRLCALPQHYRDACGRSGWSGSHSFRQPDQHSRRNAAEYERKPRRLGHGSSKHQARESHGYGCAEVGRHRAVARIPGEPQMSAVRENADTLEPLHQLERAWKHPGGILGWFSYTTHQAIGMRYIVTAFIFLLIGGIEALLMRTQLAVADNTFLSAEKYNQIFTIHGTTMMFLFAVPVMEGMGVYLIPLMIGTRNVAFPRLNAFGYWMYLFGGLVLYFGVFTNTMPDAGWFAYPPLSGPQYSPGKGVDFWAQMITFTEISALCVAAELIATILKMRAPGMTLNRIPIYCWAC